MPNLVTLIAVDNYDPGRRNSNENKDNGENVITRHHQQHRKAKTSGRTIHSSDNYQQEYNEVITITETQTLESLILTFVAMQKLPSF